MELVGRRLAATGQYIWHLWIASIYQALRSWCFSLNNIETADAKKEPYRDSVSRKKGPLLFLNAYRCLLKEHSNNELSSERKQQEGFKRCGDKSRLPQNSPFLDGVLCFLPKKEAAEAWGHCAFKTEGQWRTLVKNSQPLFHFQFSFASSPAPDLHWKSIYLNIGWLQLCHCCFKSINHPLQFLKNECWGTNIS